MTDKSTPTVQELAAMPENEFLKLCRDATRSDSQSAFRQAGFSALSATTQGALAAMFSISGLPYAPIGAVISAAFAGVSVWQGIQALGKGVQSAFESASADTILQVLYKPETPEAVVREAEARGLVDHLAITRGVTV